MARVRNSKASKVSGDAELTAQTQRVMAAGRAILGGDMPDGEAAIDLAHSVAGRLAELPPDIRLAERRSLVSLADDLIDLGVRLDKERTRVEQRLLLRSCHAAAGRAYRTGETR